MRRRTATTLAVLLLTTATALAACSSASPTAANSAPAPTTPAATSAAPTASGPTAFNLDWDQSDFSQSTCPAAHAASTCYSGTAAGTLPAIGKITLQRSVYATGPEDANGCLTAITDGTLTNSTGALTFHATGKLCDLLATYALTSSHGTGAFAGVSVTGTITNNAGAETWTGTLVP
jgi:hypothetical protein